MKSTANFTTQKQTFSGDPTTVGGFKIVLSNAGGPVGSQIVPMPGPVTFDIPEAGDYFMTVTRISKTGTSISAEVKSAVFTVVPVVLPEIDVPLAITVTMGN